MIKVELLQIEHQEEALREEEKKLLHLDESFQDVMHSLGHFMKTDDFLEVQRKISRQMDENRSGMRKMAEGLGRIRQIYQSKERRIAERTEELPGWLYIPGRKFEPGMIWIPGVPTPDISRLFPDIDPEDILSGEDDSE